MTAGAGGEEAAPSSHGSSEPPCQLSASHGSGLGRQSPRRGWDWAQHPHGDPGPRRGAKPLMPWLSCLGDLGASPQNCPGNNSIPTAVKITTRVTRWKIIPTAPGPTTPEAWALMHFIEPLETTAGRPDCQNAGAVPQLPWNCPQAAMFKVYLFWGCVSHSHLPCSQTLFIGIDTDEALYMAKINQIMH